MATPDPHLWKWRVWTLQSAFLTAKEQSESESEKDSEKGEGRQKGRKGGKEEGRKGEGGRARVVL